MTKIAFLTVFGFVVDSLSLYLTVKVERVHFLIDSSLPKYLWTLFL